MPIARKTKTVSAYFTEEDTDQIRAALKAVGHIEGYISITELVEAATLRELRRLRRKHNGGKKWPGIPAGEARPGRRTREEIRCRGIKLDGSVSSRLKSPAAEPEQNLRSTRRPA